MIRKLTLIATVVMLSALSFAQQLPITGNITTATAGPGNCVSFRAQNNSTVGIIVSGTWTGTITPTMNIFPARPINKKVLPVDGTTAQATITANGGFVANVGGFAQFQVCATAWTSGTAVIDMFSTPAPNNSTIAGGGGSGSGTVNSGTTPQVGYYATTGTAISGDPSLTDNQTTLAYGGTGGITGASLGATGTGAGLLKLGQGADNSASCPANTDCSEAPTAVTTAFTRVGQAAGPAALSIEEYTALSSGKTTKTFNAVIGTDTSIPSAAAGTSFIATDIACGDANNGLTPCFAPTLGGVGVGTGQITFAGNTSNSGTWGCIAAACSKIGSATANVSAAKYSTATSCAATGTAANPSVASCAASVTGLFSCATAASTGTCTVNTTNVTASSTIIVTQRTDTVAGTAIGVTCNTTKDSNSTAPQITAVVAATSFTIQLGTITTNPECFNYVLIN